MLDCIHHMSFYFWKNILMLDRVQHRTILFLLLQGIVRSPWSSFLAFKGGTLLYFFHGLERFSVDLDFDVMQILKDVDGFVDGMTRLFSQHSEVVDYKDKKFTYFWLLRHQSHLTKVKIECNKRYCASTTYEWQSWYGQTVRCHDKASAFAHKLCALTTRKSEVSRDLFDIHFCLSRGWPVNDGVIEEVIGLTTSAYFQVVRNFIAEKFASHSLLEWFGELVDEKQKLWVKQYLKDETLGLLDVRLRVWQCTMRNLQYNTKSD